MGFFDLDSCVFFLFFRLYCYFQSNVADGNGGCFFAATRGLQIQLSIEGNHSLNSRSSVFRKKILAQRNGYDAFLGNLIRPDFIRSVIHRPFLFCLDFNFIRQCISKGVPRVNDKILGVHLLRSFILNFHSGFRVFGDRLIRNLFVFSVGIFHHQHSRCNPFAEIILHRFPGCFLL